VRALVVGSIDVDRSGQRSGSPPESRAAVEVRWGLKVTAQGVLVDRHA
jgi:hypothetical protein